MITHCPKCKTELVEAPGIGPYCPNKECDIVDGPAVCLNCDYMMWMVAVGQGVKCKHKKNEVDGKLFNVPNRFHRCIHWEENS